MSKDVQLTPESFRAWQARRREGNRLDAEEWKHRTPEERFLLCALLMGSGPLAGEIRENPEENARMAETWKKMRRAYGVE